jgi:ABC-2 type transport system ATP-binding protein
MAGGAAAIRANGLSRDFKGGTRAVDDLSLAIAPGEIYALLGPNGAGKSTTVLMLTTLLRPTRGSAAVAGHDVRRDSAAVRAAIGVTLQNAALDPRLTGREHLALVLRLHGTSRPERRRRTDTLLEELGLAGVAGRRVRSYSVGMQRRLELAVALAHEPRVLFLDEPTTGLDPQSRSSVWAKVSELARARGVAVFLTTQYLEEADALADTVGIIREGRLIREGSPDELKRRIGTATIEVTPRAPEDLPVARDVLRRFGALTPAPAPDAVRAKLRNGSEGIAEIVRDLDRAGVVVAALHVTQATLEDVYFQETGHVLEAGG